MIVYSQPLFAVLYHMRYLIVLFGLLMAGCQSKQNNAAAGDNNPTAASSTAQTTPAAPAGRKNIVFFGNSLTAAYNLKQEKGFPALIQQKIEEAGLAYTCIDAGLSGETTADGVNRVDWVIRKPVHVFVLELGGNDALRGLPLDKTRDNLDIILRKVSNLYPDCKLVVAGMQAPPNLGKAYTNEFKSMFPALAEKNKAALIPFLLDGVAGDPALNLPDGIHPNEKGQVIVAENIWKVLQPILK
jgi:acyl-CoA thioesterase I